MRCRRHLNHEPPACLDTSFVLKGEGEAHVYTSVEELPARASGMMAAIPTTSWPDGGLTPTRKLLYPRTNPASVAAAWTESTVVAPTCRLRLGDHGKR